LLVDPTGTFPKATAAGLTLNALAGATLELVAVVESPLALVTPVHPYWRRAADKTSAHVKRAGTRETLCSCDSLILR
jgi:hypothetical protein